MAPREASKLECVRRFDTTSVWWISRADPCCRSAVLIRTCHCPKGSIYLILYQYKVSRLRAGAIIHDMSLSKCFSLISQTSSTRQTSSMAWLITRPRGHGLHPSVGRTATWCGCCLLLAQTLLTLLTFIQRFLTQSRGRGCINHGGALGGRLG